jgi:hypothetical protein
LLVLHFLESSFVLSRYVEVDCNWTSLGMYLNNAWVC